MKKICKIQQIESLKMQNVIGEEMAKHFKEQFLHLMKSIEEGVAVYDFSMEAYGSIILFESDDNFFNLYCIGFENRAITLLLPEYVEVKIYDGKEYYEDVVVCNNEYVVTFIAPKGVYAEEIEQWFLSETTQE